MKKFIFYVFTIVIALFYFPILGFAHGEKEVHGEGLSHYSFFELWSPSLFLLIAVAMWVYVVTLKKKYGDGVLPIKKVISFVSGLLIFYLALGSPLHILGDSYLFSAHMLQQSLVYIFVPPLLLIGLVDEIPERWLQKKWVIKFLKKPLILLFLFNVLFSFYHIPLLFEIIVGNSVIHFFGHLLLTVSAFLMWIPIVPLSKELESLTELPKIGYIFAGGVLLTPACALILFADTPLYPTYMATQPLFPILPPIDDQQLGGIIMKVAQEMVYGSMIGYIFVNWAKKEQKVDPIIDVV